MKNNEKFNKNWKKEAFKIRCLQIYLDLGTGNINLGDFILFLRSMGEKVNKHIFNEIKKYKETDEYKNSNEKEKPKLVKSWCENNLEDKNANEFWATSSIFDDIKPRKKTTFARLKRSVSLFAFRKVKSYILRNKRFPNSQQNVRIHKKSFPFVDGVVSVNNLERIPTDNTSYSPDSTKLVFGKLERLSKISKTYSHTVIIKIPYLNFSCTGYIPKITCKNCKNKEKCEKCETVIEDNFQIGEPMGGNLVINKKNQSKFIVQIKYPIKWKYEPKQFLGIDMNKDPRYWMVFNKKIEFYKKSIISKPKKIKELENEILLLNNQKNEKNLVKAKQRRWIRKKIEKKHKQHNEMCKIYCEEIIKFCENNEFALAIDHLTCGADTGSFGQDKLVHNLVLLCEEKGIPYILVPTPYTSKVCFKCKSKTKDENRTGDKIKCHVCNKIINAHCNASNNIAYFGKSIMNKGISEFRKDRDKKYKKAKTSLL
jgi:hypothetical protein